MFLGTAIVAGLLTILVGLLINNVKRKAKTNIKLTNLNAEVSRQKDNLDRINHHLEEIIDERTQGPPDKKQKTFRVFFLPVAPDTRTDCYT
ncbi:MAG TPA: hypothetical protein DCO83_01585 [Mucilaginibacter sp.]|nr:hypothetical protein [Mucilaginibacter sp.]